MIDQHKSEPSSSAIPSPSIPPSSKIVAGSITPKADPLALQPALPHSVVQKETAVKTTMGGAVVKEENAGKNSTTSAVPGKVVTENVATGKKKMGATGGGSSLANLWGKAPAKVKAATPPLSAAVPTVVTGKFLCAWLTSFGSHVCKPRDSHCPSCSIGISVPVLNRWYRN